MVISSRKVKEQIRKDNVVAWTDPRVEAYLHASGEERAGILAELLAGVRPVMERIVRSFRRAESVFNAPRTRPVDADEQWVEADQFQRMESRRFLETLWREVVALGPLHRVAVLLNLREREGGNAAALFILLGIATFEEVAEALQMRVGELAEIWNALPLDDCTIAARLKMTRQQVINLRKTARERLGRRLTPFLRK